MNVSKKRRAKKPLPPKKTIRDYNVGQTGESKKICTLLLKEFTVGLKGAESKIWHGSPVWFYDGNPVAAFTKLKDSVQVLFWSGQTFHEPELTKEGSFKAAEKRYQSVDEVRVGELRRWLKKAKTIQWDYKNIVKNRGKLTRIR